MIVAANPLAHLIGAVESTVLIGIGIVLLLYALDLARTAFGSGIPRGRIVYFIVMDGAWVVGSARVLWGFSLPFTPAGSSLILGIAAVIALLGILQYAGLRRLSNTTVEVVTT